MKKRKTLNKKLQTMTVQLERQLTVVEQREVARIAKETAIKLAGTRSTDANNEKNKETVQSQNRGKIRGSCQFKGSQTITGGRKNNSVRDDADE